MTDNAGNAVSILTKRKVIGYQMGSMPEPEQEDSNYIFDGWWMQPNGGTKVTSKTAVTGPMTVYAHWTIGNLVFLEKNGGAYYHKYKSAGNIENKFKKWNPVKWQMDKKYQNKPEEGSYLGQREEIEESETGVM